MAKNKKHNGPKKVDATPKVDLSALPRVNKNVKSNLNPIPKSITPYDIFLRCIKRAENLINFHSDDKNPTEEHFCDAYRASVVLTIAALDAYTRTVTITK
jgi:hypothetical protein